MANEEIVIEQKKNYVRNYIIFLQALAGMAGSLYFEHFGNIVRNIEMGNIFPADAGITPCTLCRWTRILLYPLVWFGFAGLVNKDPKVVNTFTRVSGAGILLTLYQHFTELSAYQAMEYCKTNDCSDVFIQYFGFLTIPLLGALAFAVIFICCLLAKREIQKNTIIS